MKTPDNRMSEKSLAIVAAVTTAIYFLTPDGIKQYAVAHKGAGNLLVLLMFLSFVAYCLYKRKQTPLKKLENITSNNTPRSKFEKTTLFLLGLCLFLYLIWSAINDTKF